MTSPLSDIPLYSLAETLSSLTCIAFAFLAEAMIAFRRQHPALHPLEFYTPGQVAWFRPDGGAADSNYFANADNHAIA
jgi:hypothetical protein